MTAVSFAVLSYAIICLSTFTKSSQVCSAGDFHCLNWMDNTTTAALDQELGPDHFQPDALSLLSQRARQKRKDVLNITSKIATTTTGITANHPIAIVEGGVFSGEKDDFLNLGCSWREELGAPMSIAFRSRMIEATNFARIIDFAGADSGGEDAIIIGNHGTSSDLLFQIKSGVGGTGEIKVPNAFTIGKEEEFLFTVSEIGEMYVYKNGQRVGSNEKGNYPDTKIRKYMYIAKSNSVDEGTNFKGLIQHVHIYQKVMTWGEAYPGSLSCTDLGRFKPAPSPIPTQPPASARAKIPLPNVNAYTGELAHGSMPEPSESSTQGSPGPSSMYSKSPSSKTWAQPVVNKPAIEDIRYGYRVEGGYYYSAQTGGANGIPYWKNGMGNIGAYNGEFEGWQKMLWLKENGWGRAESSLLVYCIFVIWTLFVCQFSLCALYTQRDNY